MLHEDRVSTKNSTRINSTANLKPQTAPILLVDHRKYAVILLLIGCVVMSLTGCRRFQNLAVREAVMVSYRDMVWARRAFNLRYGNCARPYGDHFENGFCAGYTDVCNGGDGYVPAMPPPDYRSFEYQSGDGVQCVNAWFEGYPAGVAAAKKEKVGNYNDVLISKMVNSAVNQDKAKHILPGDVPIVDNNKNSQASSQAATPVSYPNGMGTSNNQPLPITHSNY